MGRELRLATATEEALGQCIKRRIWAGRKRLSRNWSLGQLLLVRVDSRLAALAVVQGELDEVARRRFSDQFPLTVPVEWVWVADKAADRPVFGDWITDELRSAWGEHYGFRILNQTILPSQQATRILKKLEKQTGLLVDDLVVVQHVAAGSR